MNIAHTRHAFTWFRLIEPPEKTVKRIHGFYEKLVNLHREVNEEGNTSSPLYQWNMTKEQITAYVTYEGEGLTVALCPTFDRYVNTDDLYYELGGSSYCAVLDDVGGSPSYSECMKVVTYLLSAIHEKVGTVETSDLQEYCRGGNGYIVLTEDTAPYTPLTSTMHEIGLMTPDDLLERMGYFGPQ